ncbi:nucleotide pyrophosphatase [Paenibacillus sambharensis]|uniref:Nucleotide pyrophosphatase n=1 Tax=Paenibacillus sambharensis TaxID=1803190 RepID=A0A2W1LEF4_9BACL|nr:alkaline phosphatase family protein [Paenibacillus sambharensis]PZD97049.1 nucleotide pyrophosphatase [Paenibacillus sambharensis]
MNKLIMVVLDGLRYDTARQSMGYLNHLVEHRQAAVYKVVSELPSLSRPLYEVLLTGTPAWLNGITANHMARLSSQTSLFHLARQQGRRTAAAAYYWVSELVQRAPFHYAEDREQHNEALPIQHSKFYFDDSYPDSHLLLDGEVLRRQWDPHFLYIHPMGIDDAGHKYGADSKQYRGKAIEVDSLLAALVPGWMKEGYHVLITSDHGMNKDGQHGGTGCEEREVPLYCISPVFVPGEYSQELSQLWLAPLCCRILGIPLSSAMTMPADWEGLQL